MQVQHHIGIAGQCLQGQALRVQLCARHLCAEQFSQLAANQLQVLCGIVAELAFKGVTNLRAQVQEVAVEVLPALQFVAAQRDIHHYLLEASRVGHWHDDDLTEQAPGRLQFCKALLEVPGNSSACSEAWI